MSMPSWSEDVSGARSWSDLPEAARRLIERIEALGETPAPLLSVGPERDALICR